jgi:hypothetical protein
MGQAPLDLKKQTILYRVFGIKEPKISSENILRNGQVYLIS